MHNIIYMYTFKLLTLKILTLVHTYTQVYVGVYYLIISCMLINMQIWKGAISQSSNHWQKN